MGLKKTKKDEKGTWGLKSNKSHLDPWSTLAEHSVYCTQITPFVP